MNTKPEPSALLTHAMQTVEELKAENARLLEQNAALMSETSQRTADLVSQRFAAQQQAEQSSLLTRQRADLVEAVRIIQRAVENRDNASFMVRAAVADMCASALRQAGEDE